MASSENSFVSLCHFLLSNVLHRHVLLRTSSLRLMFVASGFAAYHQHWYIITLFFLDELICKLLEECATHEKNSNDGDWFAANLVLLWILCMPKCLYVDVSWNG
ncbi:hypothetical protein E3N88_43885 [Mikania micrantha]|uniref:Uncharacterized protein n=1 Tax=Mikania micrantha TaxID=192012 RepID=A0A5N6LDL5_9ASTR|nr:hypothetical protein E3N88_43885 [Mikania micrantha]